jgi:hypothetical protein
VLSMGLRPVLAFHGAANQGELLSDPMDDQCFFGRYEENEVIRIA